MIWLCYFIFINIFAFIVYGVDKKKAKDGKWRISESFLILTAVMGGALGAFLGMIVWHHKTRKKKFTITVPVLLGLQIVCHIFIFYQNHHIVETYYNVDIGLGEDLRIVQISDLHNQFYGFDQSALLNRIEALEPDIIAVTGDVIDSRTPSYTLTYNFFEGAVKIAPVYYVTGNHEARFSEEKLSDFLSHLEEIGVVVLDDRYIDLGSFYLAGIADESLMYFDKYEPFTGSKPVIMLAHEPEYHDLYRRLGADLVLTGHIHGGQFIIPGKGGLLSPDFEVFYEYYEGIHEFGDCRMIVSRGLGNSVIPVRINNYPEIVIADVK